MILLDMCVVSQLAKPEPDRRVTAWIATVPDADLRLSVLTLGEVQEGADLLEPGRRRADVERWLEGLQVSNDTRN